MIVNSKIYYDCISNLNISTRNAPIYASKHSKYRQCRKRRREPSQEARKNLWQASLLPPLLHPEQIIKRRRRRNLHNNIHPKDTKVPPLITCHNARHTNIRICCAHRAVLTPCRSVRVQQIPPSKLRILSQILAAGLTRRGVKNRQLRR